MPANMKKAGMKYGKGGSKGPKASNYIGNPMGYFNDKAAFRRAQMGTETDSNIEPLEAVQAIGKDIRQNKIDKLKQKREMAKIKAETAGYKADKARENSDKRAARKQNRLWNKN